MAVSSTALVSLAEVKAYLKIATTDDDVRLELLIDNVSARILAHLNNNVVIQSRTEYHYGGKKRIYLQRYPLVSGPTISDAAGNTIPSTDYITIPEQGILQHWGCWPTAQDANGNSSRWTVAYSAGLAVNTASVPADLKDACAVWVARRFNRTDQSIRSKSIGDLSISYAAQDDQEGVPADIAALLAPYRSQGF